MPGVTVVRYLEHEDHDDIKRAETITWERFGGHQFQVRSRRHKRGFFLLYNRGDTTFASKGFFLRLSDLRDNVEEFAKALGLSLLVLAPMLLPGGGI